MDRMKSAKAIELEKAIDKLRSEIKYWSNATAIHSIHVKTENGYPSIDISYVSFKALKAITISTLEEKLEKLQLEYEAL